MIQFNEERQTETDLVPKRATFFGQKFVHLGQ